MPLFSRFLLILLICVFGKIGDLNATHNRAGEITFSQIGSLQIEMTITTYTKASSVNADRDSLKVFWGDGTVEWVKRSNGNGLFLENDTKLNLYISTHTYPGTGTYTISMADPNRNGGILNVAWPSSESVPFYLETTFTFLNQQFQGGNSSPKLLQPPIDVACLGQPFIHNPNAYDAEGDSLSYELIVPQQEVSTPVPSYMYPSQIVPGPFNSHTLNAFNGTFQWITPQAPGEYNIAMRINEYREGVLISSMIRDMQIFVLHCDDNKPPVIDIPEDICVIAGERIEFDVIATDPDTMPVNRVRLSALGGPFEVDTSPAEFQVASGYQDQPLVGKFIWQTNCNHIADQYYTVIFRAVDDFPIIDNHSGGTVDTNYLSTIRTFRIKIVGPPPLEVEAEAGRDSILVTWQEPYICQFTSDNYFQGFSVWRKEGSNQFPIDTCTPGLDGKGYTKIAFNTTDTLNGDYFYIDYDVDRGKSYCYRILGEFAKTSAGGFPFNRVESLTSDEFCVQLGKDIPLITHVDVDETSLTDGKITVQWSKPIAEDLDTLMNPGPYEYQIFRAPGFTDAGLVEVPGARFISNTFSGANDTIWQDDNLDTESQPYSYRIGFYVNNEAEPIGYTNVASSLFLSIYATDEKNELSWEEMVPWDNAQYIIYRLNNGTLQFDSIGVTTELNYDDEGLINGNEYCYRIESIGSYGVAGVVSPLRNKSQEVCAIPIDNVPPCPPTLGIFNICDQNPADLPIDDFENLLYWTNPNNQCTETDDVVQYNISYTPFESGAFSIIETLNSPDDTTLLHRPDFGIAGCYVVTAIDSVGNESDMSNVVCVDNCPLFELPNTFTPNNDGANDLFVPRKSRFISSIDFKVFNQWGQLVFETSDPNINWDGTNLQGKSLNDGVYYYTCKVFEQRVAGILQQQNILKGYIELLK